MKIAGDSIFYKPESIYIGIKIYLIYLDNALHLTHRISKAKRDPRSSIHNFFNIIYLLRHLPLALKSVTQLEREAMGFPGVWLVPPRIGESLRLRVPMADYK